jgi:GNAT superfamily N-acetyltransferase
MTIDIRAVLPGDEVEWRRLWRAYLSFYQAELSDEVFRSTFARLIGNDPQDYNGLIATIDDKPVGLAHYLFHRHGWKLENVCYLQDLYADESVRGQGIGRRLIESVYAAADKAGASSVYWLTQQDNSEARRLYDRIGVKTSFIKYQRPS